MAQGYKRATVNATVNGLILTRGMNYQYSCLNGKLSVSTLASSAYPAMYITKREAKKCIFEAKKKK